MKVLAIFTVLGIFCVKELRAKDCKQLSLCSCQFDDGTTMDITSLGHYNNSPAFKDVLAGDEGNYYSYNPCVGFTEGNCQGASVCILNPNKSESVQIGDSWKAGYKYDDDSGDVVVAYTSGTMRNLKQSEVLLVCDPSVCTPSIVANGQQKGGAFRLTLTTVCACPNGCSALGPNNCGSTGSHVKALDMGTMLCILLMIVALFTTLT